MNVAEKKPSVPKKPNKTVDREALFERWAKRLEEEALELQYGRYGKREILIWELGPDMRQPNFNYLPYHHHSPTNNYSHPREVIEAAELILRAIKKGGVPVTERDIRLARVIAAFHDAVQEWRPEREREAGRWGGECKRLIGDNEQMSADELIACMERANEEANAEIFSESDMKVGRAAIMATVPGFDTGHNTVIQPNLTVESGPLVRAIALADLAVVGMGGGARYVDVGNRLFREENLDLIGIDAANLADWQKEALAQRMLAWKKFQPKFAAGRRDLFETEIAPLPEGAKEELHKLFCKFDESIVAAQEDADKLAEVVEAEAPIAERFEQALILMGYEIDERNNGKRIVYP